MNKRTYLIGIIAQAIKDLGYSAERVNPSITETADPTHGDFATPTAFVLARLNQKTPNEIAAGLVATIEKHLAPDSIVAKIEIVNGYINFFLKPEDQLANLKVVLDAGAAYGQSRRLIGQKVMLEYTDPNPFKVLHIGHLMPNTIGEALARLYTAVGADVKRANYQGDVGMHVAKAIWGLMQTLKSGEISLDAIEQQSLEARVVQMGKAYAFGAQAFDEEVTARAAMTKINQFVYAAAQALHVQESGWVPRINYPGVDQSSDLYLQIAQLYKLGRAWSLEYFETMYKKLGTKFDFYYFESMVGELGLELVQKYRQEGVFVESEGAVVYPGEKDGLHTRVFINSLGLPVYEAKDLALAFLKYEDYAYDRSLIITGNEIDDYFKVVLSALSAINQELASKTTHLSHGMLRLTSGKMSSRTGTIIGVDDLINEIKAAVLAVMSTDRGIAEAQRSEIAEKIAIACFKYSVLKQKIGRDIVFDPQEAVAFDGNTGAYLLYTYARIQSVLRRGLDDAVEQKEMDSSPSSNGTKDEVSEMVKLIERYPEVIEQAAQEHAPQLLCTLLYDLAREYNGYYAKTQILTSNPALRNTRLMLTRAVGQVLANGLTVLGIPLVEQM